MYRIEIKIVSVIFKITTTIIQRFLRKIMADNAVNWNPRRPNRIIFVFSFQLLKSLSITVPVSIMAWCSASSSNLICYHIFGIVNLRQPLNGWPKFEKMSGLRNTTNRYDELLGCSVLQLSQMSPGALYSLFFRIKFCFSVELMMINREIERYSGTCFVFAMCFIEMFKFTLQDICGDVFIKSELDKKKQDLL